MNEEIEQSKQAQPMVKQLPTKLWQQVGTDLFYYDGKYYIIITDYYSFWPEVYLLKSKTATNVSDAMKNTICTPRCSRRRSIRQWPAILI